MANFRHVTKCRGGSGGDLTSFLPVRCLMLKLVHSQISKPWECHLYFAQGCHLNFALTDLSPKTDIRQIAGHFTATHCTIEARCKETRLAVVGQFDPVTI